MNSDPAAAEVTTAVLEWLRAELDDPDITAADNFLDIGAHSLTFTRLNRHLTASLGVVLDVRTTYESALGDAIAARRSADQPMHQ